jgi:hypothetical protein
MHCRQNQTTIQYFFLQNCFKLVESLGEAYKIPENVEILRKNNKPFALDCPAILPNGLFLSILCRFGLFPKIPRFLKNAI